MGYFHSPKSTCLDGALPTRRESRDGRLLSGLLGITEVFLFETRGEDWVDECICATLSRIPGSCLLYGRRGTVGSERPTVCSHAISDLTENRSTAVA